MLLAASFEIEHRQERGSGVGRFRDLKAYQTHAITALLMRPDLSARSLPSATTDQKENRRTFRLRRFIGSTWTGIRTQDQLVKSQLLYQLSYPRMLVVFSTLGRAGGRLKVSPQRMQGNFQAIRVENRQSKRLGQWGGQEGAGDSFPAWPKGAISSSFRPWIHRRTGGSRGISPSGWVR